MMKAFLAIWVHVIFFVFASACDSKRCESKQCGVKVSHVTVGSKNFYFGIFVKLSYFDAMAFCNHHGMKMAAIESKKENDAIVVYRNQLGFPINANAWTSGSNLSASGKFAWLSIGRLIGPYQNYDLENLNNDGKNERCVELRDDGKWNIQDCRTQNYVICQYSSCC